MCAEQYGNGERESQWENSSQHIGNISLELLDAIFSKKQCYESMCSTQKGIEQKVIEELVIINAYTVADPWAMMIHSHYTLIAHWTVMCSRWFNLFAFVTISKSDKASAVFMKHVIYFILLILPLLINSWSTCSISL